MSRDFLPHFQSPLHRGILCNRWKFPRHKSRRKAFSPLFIGEYSATAWKPQDAWPATTFSPLFIGEYSATAGRHGRDVRHQGFQSPLHRGILCNGYGADPRGNSRALFQSPLHRGILCNDPRLNPSDPRLNPFQSPLHRGILCNFSAALRNAIAAAFQSPLHRGILCNKDQGLLAGLGIQAFSPLFIGEYSATRRTSSTVAIRR